MKITSQKVADDISSLFKSFALFLEDKENRTDNTEKHMMYTKCLIKHVPNLGAY
jgi:hypothetical protein